MEPGRDRIDGRIHEAVVGLLLVVEHRPGRSGRRRRRHARRPRHRSSPAGVRRGARAATRSASPGSSPTCERPSLIEATTASCDVDGHDAPSRATRTGRRAAGPSCPRRRPRPCPRCPGSPVHGATRRGGSWRHGLDRQLDRPAEEARGAGRGAGGDRHRGCCLAAAISASSGSSASSIGRRSAADASSASASATAHSPSSPSTTRPAAVADDRR